MKKRSNLIWLGLLIVVLTIGATFAGKILDSVYQDAKYPTYRVSNIDSAVTQTTDSYLVDKFDNQTLYCTGYFTSTANDSIMVVFKGKLNNYSDTKLLKNMDTLFMAANSLYQVALTPTFVAPRVAIEVIPYNSDGTTNNGDVVNDGTLELNLYTKTVD